MVSTLNAELVASALLLDVLVLTPAPARPRPWKNPLINESGVASPA